MKGLLNWAFRALLLARDYVDRVLGNGSSRSCENTKLARLRLFTVLGLLATGAYACHDAIHRAYWTGGMHAMGFVILCGSAILSRYPWWLSFGSHLVTSLLTVLFGLIPLWDGHIHAPGLWPAVLVSAVVAFLFESRIVILYALFGIAMVLVNWFFGPYFDHLPRVTRTVEQWLVLRLFTLLLFGGVIGISAASSIRARRKVQAMTQALLSRAEQQDVAKRSKSAFLATMSCELYVPVTSLARLAEKNRLDLVHPQLSNPINEVCSSAARLVHILASVSDLAHLESGKAELTEAPFTIGVLLDGLQAQFSESAKAKNLSLSITDEFGPRTLIGDAQRIYQVLASLVDNAIKFSDGGLIQVNARRERTSRTDNLGRCSLVICVRDQGIGMNQAQRERVFGHFEQVHEDEERQRGGCGLGLAVSERLVRLMGGTLRVDSEQGRGTAFTCGLNLEFGDCEPVETDLSIVLGLDLSEITEFDEQEHLRNDLEKHSGVDPELGYFVEIVAPFVLVLLSLAIFRADFMAAMTHALCFAGMVVCGTTTVGRRLGHRAWVVFLLATACSIFCQSILDASLYSEALWGVLIVPTIAAYVFGLRYAILSAGVSAGVIGSVALHGFGDVSNTFGQNPVGFTIALRVAFTLAVVGSTILVMRGSRSKIRAMQEHQLSMRDVSLAAKQANEEKGRFFARIAEELGAPLRKIIDIVDAQATTKHASPAQLKLLDRTGRCARSISCLLERGLLSAGADVTKDIDERRVFDLRQLMDDALLLFADEANSHRTELRVEDTSDALWVLGNPSRMLELLTLLMSYVLSGADAGEIYLCIQDAPSEQPNQRALCLQWRSQARIRSDSTDRARRERAWARALDTTRCLGGELGIVGREDHAHTIELGLVFDVAPLDRANVA